MRVKDYTTKNIAYHSDLSSDAWTGEKLQTEVRYKLLEIAKIFIDYLDVPGFRVLDIVLTGSLANYNYTEFSDFDIHVVTDYGDLECDNIAEAFYSAKKQLWNDAHDIIVHGHEAELYVEDINEPPVSGGVFSLLDNKWLTKPDYNPPKINSQAVNTKTQDLIVQIERAIKTADDSDDFRRIFDKIKKMRRSGLASGGEFSVENLTFKVLRNEGYIGRLVDAWHDQQDSELSLAESELDEAQLYVDVPNDEWLQDKVEYAQSKKRNSYGVPYMGSTTAFTRDDVRVPVDILKRLPGMRGEQKNVRKEDLFAIMKIMKDTGKLPLTDRGEEYAPFINVAHNGEAWVNEGNHRIMAAAALGWKDIPVQISYFDGGERVKKGPMYPGNIGLGPQVSELSLAESLSRCRECSWTIIESSEKVIVYVSDILDDSLSNKSDKIHQRLRHFIASKLENPLSAFGKSDTSFNPAGPIGNIEKLRHAHLSQDVSVFYTIEGQEPKILKIYGVFSHSESGTSTAPKKQRQQQLTSRMANAKMKPLRGYSI